MKVTMKEIPKWDRPRERLAKYGVEQLNNEELLTILLGSGTGKGTVKDVALSLLQQGGMEHLKEMKYVDFIKLDGIGPAKACTLLAALELGKRTNMETIERKQINQAKLVYQFYKDRLGDKKQEYFYCIYLDQQKRILKECLLFIGTLNQSLVHPREIFKEACILSASSIICVHNHPSGNTDPSREDIALTKRLVSLGLELGIPINDHVIIGKDTYYSFFEQGEL